MSFEIDAPYRNMKASADGQISSQNLRPAAKPWAVVEALLNAWASKVLKRVSN